MENVVAIAVAIVLIVAGVALILSIVALFQLSDSRKKTAKLRGKIEQLNPQEIAKRAVKNLEELSENIQEQIRGIVRSETENLSDRLKKNETEIEAQKEKLDNLRSRIRENGQKIVNGIFGVLKEIFGPILKEKPEETTAGEPENEEILGDEEIPADKAVPAGEKTGIDESGQQATEVSEQQDTEVSEQ